MVGTTFSTRGWLRTLVAVSVLAVASPMLTACGDESTGDGGDDDDGGSGDSPGGIGSGSSQAGQACSGEGTAVCAGSDAMDLCVDGTYETFTCSEYCGFFGFSPAGCSNDGCACAEPINDHCLHAVGVMCGCYDAADVPCTDDEATEAYVLCHQNADVYGSFVNCLGNYDPSSLGQCVNALESCQ